MTAYAALALAILAWGSEYPLIKAAAGDLGAVLTGAVMFTVASLLLGLQLTCRGAFRRDRLPAPRVLGAMLIVGLLSSALNFAALAALRLTSVTNVATLARTDVLFSLALAALWFHEPIDRAAWLATPLMLGGVVLLTGILASPPGPSNLGDGLVLFSAFLVAFNAYLVRYAARRTDPSLIGFINTLLCSLAFLLAALLLPSGGSAFGSVGKAFTHPVALWLGVLVALFLAGYYVALRELPVWKVRLLMLLIPVVSALGGLAWLGEPITPVKALGMTLVCCGAAGVLLAQCAPHPNWTAAWRKHSPV